MAAQVQAVTEAVARASASAGTASAADVTSLHDTTAIVTIEPEILEGFKPRIYPEVKTPVGSHNILGDIAGIAETIVKQTTSNDILIFPGRSVIQAAKFIESLGLVNDKKKRVIYKPAFSLGALVLMDDAKIWKIFEGIAAGNKTKSERVRKNFEATILPYASKTEPPDQRFIKKVLDFLEEEDTIFYYDFEQKKLVEAHNFKFSDSVFKDYKEYLKAICGLTPEVLSACKGTIFIVDTIYSGYGIKGFTKVLLLWCQQEGVDISGKIKLLNVTGRHEDLGNRVAHNNIIISKQAFAILDDHGMIPNESHYFPPYAWSQRALWRPNITEAIRALDEELKTYVEQREISQQARLGKSTFPSHDFTVAYTASRETRSFSVTQGRGSDATSAVKIGK